MIDPKELRIGNIVLWNNVETIVESIIQGNEDNVSQINLDYYYDSEGYANGYSLKEADPIPLTPEWLERLGFAGMILGTFSFTQNMDLRIAGFEHDYNGLYIGKIHHVHQLQNLYFALTGEELTIKEPA